MTTQKKTASHWFYYIQTDWPFTDQQIWIEKNFSLMNVLFKTLHAHADVHIYGMCTKNDIHNLFYTWITSLALYCTPDWKKGVLILASNSLFKQTFIKGTMCLKGLSQLWTTLTWTPHVVKNENQRYTSDTSRNLLQFCLLFHSIFDFYWNSVSVWVFFYSCYNIISFHHIWLKTVWCWHISCDMQIS